jgi:hypothetical protein
VSWDVCFRYIPRQALDALGFAKPFITINDFFEENGNFRFIEEVCAYNNDEEEDHFQPIYIGNQIALLEGLRVFFREEIEKQSTYLEDWLHFCTGQAFIPDLVVYKNFKVFFEFSHVEEMTNEGALPDSHTCVNTIKLPASAYGGSIEVFKKKMKMAMELSGDGFNNV